MKGSAPLNAAGRDPISTSSISGALQAVGRESQGLLAVRAGIEQARVLIAAGKGDDGLRAIDEAMSPISGDGSARSDAHRQILAAVSKSLSGMALLAAGREEEARSAFQASVDGFGRCRRRSLSSRDLSDFGVAEDALGRDAADILRRAVDGGEPTQEACRRLAAILRRGNDLDGALEVIRHALELVPDDILSLVELAGILEAKAQPRDAAEALRIAGWRMASADNRPEDAVVLFERAIALDPENPAGHGIQGELLRIIGRNDEALESFDRALRLAPDSPWVLASKAMVLATLEQYQPALSFLDRAVALDPEYPWALSVRAEVRLILGDAEGAEKDLVGAVTLSPSGAAWLRLGYVRRQKDDPSGALEAYEKASELEPTNVDALIARSEVLMAMDGRAEEAWGLAQSAAALDPQRPEPLDAMGESLRLLRKYPEALAALDQALKLAPDAAWTVATRGQVLFNLGRPADAVNDLQRAVALAPEMSWAHIVLADALSDLGRNDDALSAVDAALRQQPGDVAALRVKGRLLVELKQPQDALDAVAVPLEADPSDAYALTVKARALRALGELDGAEDSFRKAAAADPTGITALIDLAFLLDGRDRSPEALKALDEAVARQPQHGQALAFRGRLLANAGRQDQALEDLQRAAALDDCPDWVWTKISELRYYQGQYLASVQAADRALEVRAYDADALAWKAGALFMIDRDDEAMDTVEACLRASPQHVVGLRIRGSILAWGGKYEEALASYQAALDVDGDDVNALVGAGRALTQLNRQEEATGSFERALTLAPGDFEALLAMGDLLRLLNRFDEAELVLEKALASRPEDPRALRSAGYVDSGLGRYEDAVGYFERLRTLLPEDATTLADLATALGRIDRYTEALDLANKAVSYGDDAWALATLGVILQDIGDYAGSAEVLARAVRHNVPPRWMWINLGWTLGRIDGRSEDAKAAFDAALATDEPGYDVAALTGRADVLRHLGDNEAADADCVEAIRRNEERHSNDPDDLAMVAWCHFGMRQFDAAVDILLKALTLSPNLTSAQFDLALVMLCRKQGAPAVREYEHGIAQLAPRHPLRRHGILAVARKDLEVAVKQNNLEGDNGEVAEIVQMLAAADVDTAAVPGG